MSTNGFCTQCGAPRTAGARFCTACGAAQSGQAPSRPAIAPASSQTAAIAVGVLILAIGGAATWFALQEPTNVPRAVAGSPGGGAPRGQQGQQAQQDEGLPAGHPSIELPPEVVEFLAGLAAEAEKNPQSVEAAQKLARARYRATVINESYRGPAEQALAKLLALDPGNVEGLRISANLAYDGGDFPEAEKRFRAYLDKSPEDPSALTDLGSTQLFQERPDDAIASYKAAIAKDPKFMQAHFNLGIAYEKKGDKAQAIASLKTALDLATEPDQKQHVENALASLEGREPQAIAGAKPPMGMGGGAPGSGMGGAPAGGMGGGMGGGAPAGAAPGGMGGAPAGGGMPMPPPAPDRDVPTNASSDFQRQAEKPIITHPIVGPRVVGFEWTGPASGRAKLADFPMDRMPPFARVKFKSAMAEKIAAVAKANGVAGPVKVELVDSASGNVMDTLDTATDAAGGTAPGGTPK